MEKRVKLGDIEFSVVEEEKPRDTVTITDHPVEKGQDVSDHVKQESSIIDILGIIVGDDAAEKLNKLQKYQKEGKLLSYVGRNVYSNMAIQTLDRNHGKDVRNGFAYNITLKQVRLSTAKEVELQVVSPVTKQPTPQVKTQVKKVTNNGKQQPKEKKVVVDDFGLRPMFPKDTNPLTGGRVNLKDLVKSYHSSKDKVGGGTR